MNLIGSGRAWLAFSVAIVLVAGACNAATTPSPSAPPVPSATATAAATATTAAEATFAPLAQPVELKFRNSFSPTLLYGPAYVANAKFWPDLGIKGTVLSGEGSSSTLQTVGAGSEQMGMAEFQTVAAGIKAGVPVTILAVVQQRDVNGIIFLKSNPINAWKDLEGRTVGAFPYGAGQQTLKLVMQLQGVDVTKVRIVSVNPGQELQLLQAGSINAIFGYAHAQDIWLTCAGNPAGSLSNWSAGSEPLSTTIIANNAWMKQVGDDVVARAMLGLVEGAISMKADPVSAYDIMQKAEPNAQTDRAQELAGFDPNGYIQWSFEGEAGLQEHGWGWINPDRVATSEKLWLDIGLLESQVDLTNAFTNKFLENPIVHAAAVKWATTPWGAVPADVRTQCGLGS